MQLGTTPLMLAAAAGHGPIVALLIRKGADLRLMDKTGATALIHSVRGCHEEPARALLRAGAGTNETEFGRRDRTYDGGNDVQ